MSFDFGAGEKVGAEGADFVHRWVEVMGFVGGPGGAHFAAGTQAVMMKQSQRDLSGCAAFRAERLRLSGNAAKLQPPEPEDTNWNLVSFAA